MMHDCCCIIGASSVLEKCFTIRMLYLLTKALYTRLKKKIIDHHGGRVAVFNVVLSIQLIYSQIPTSIHLVAYTLSDRLNQHSNGGQRE